MKTFVTRGIVLREVSVGEADKILILLLKGHGKLGASAKGARKSSSRFLDAAQLFTYSDLVITQGRGFYTLAQADVIETFYGLSESYERLEAASRLARLCDKVIMEHEPCDDILRILLYSLRALCREKPPDLVSAAFNLKFLEYSGLAPDIEGFREGRAARLSAGARQAAAYVLGSDVPNMFSFTAAPHVLAQLSAYAGTEIEEGLGVR